MSEIILTAKEIDSKYDWDKFCVIRGINVWAINEGLINDDEKFILTEKEFKEIGGNL